MLLLCMMIGFSVLLLGLVAVFLRQLAIDKNKIKLAETILAFGPRITFDTRDKIAHDMILSLYREHRWNSPYFFYNGGQCLHIFQRSVLVPFHLGALDKELNETEKRCVMEAIEIYRRAIIADYESCYRDFLSQKRKPLLNHNLVMSKGHASNCFFRSR